MLAENQLLKSMTPAGEFRDRSSVARIPELDGIRAMAILLVIGCHYGGFCSLLGGLPAFGWIGVDIFFVLSGFLITSILVELRGTQSPIKVFYIRRVLRIFPIYYLMIGVVAAISLANHELILHWGWYFSRVFFLQSLKPTPSVFLEAYRQLLGLRPHLSLFHHEVLPTALRGATFGPWANSLGAAWSLSVEEYFYIIWAPIVIFLKGPRKIAAAAAAIFGFSAVLRYLGCSGVDDYFEFFCRVDPIMAGAVLALFMKWRSSMPIRLQRRWDRSATILAFFLVLLMTGVLVFIRPIVGYEVRDSLLFSSVGMPVLSGILTLALGWVILHQGEPSILLRALRLKPMRNLGTISYSLYLFHVPVYYCFLILKDKLRLSGFYADLGASVAALAVALTLSALSWKYFETPILKLKDRWAPTRARVRLQTVAN